jgi:hypothetical protein
VRVAAIIVGVLFFLAVSGWLARFFTTENAERDQILSLLQAQAAGNAGAMLARLDSCAEHAGCAAVVYHDAQTERGTGTVKILALSSPTAYALSAVTGATRVAWKQGTRLPVVQCVVVHRHGSPLTGLNIALERISAPIANTADCR